MQTPLEKLSDQVIIVLTDYSYTERKLGNSKFAGEIATRIVEKAKLIEGLFPVEKGVTPSRQLINRFRAEIDALFDLPVRHRTLKEMAFRMELKNLILDQVKALLAEKEQPTEPGQVADTQYMLYQNLFLARAMRALKKEFNCTEEASDLGVSKDEAQQIGKILLTIQQRIEKMTGVA